MSECIDKPNKQGEGNGERNYTFPIRPIMAKPSVKVCENKNAGREKVIYQCIISNNTMKCSQNYIAYS